ncbi:hypothetical protein B0H14DRAFT_3447438 [Mycena olivaceomarginata]|nr:hypothetical protein B0H14DRAFT_3447438 [Mycena olivaceomarginata]
MVTEFAQEMDGLTTGDANQRAGVVVVGTTNRPQDIDSAVMRRLSHHILVDLPTADEWKAIIAQYLEDECYDGKTVNIGNLGHCTESFSGSDLRYLVYSATLAALEDTIQHNAHGSSVPHRFIQGKHFEQALKQVSACSDKNRKDVDDLRRWANKLQ